MSDSIRLGARAFVVAAVFPFLAVGWINILELFGGTNDATGVSLAMVNAAVGSVVFSNWVVR